MTISEQNLEQRLQSMIDQAMHSVRQELEGQIRSVAKSAGTNGHGSLGRLQDALALLGTAETQTELLGHLVQQAQTFAGRTAFFVAAEDGVRGWGGAGFDQQSVASTSFDYSSHGSWRRLAESGMAVELDSADCAQLSNAMLGSPGSGGILIPLTLRGSVAGALYADKLSQEDNLDSAALQILAMVAGLNLETMPLRTGQETAPEHVEEEASSEPQDSGISSAAIAGAAAAAGVAGAAAASSLTSSGFDSSVNETVAPTHFVGDVELEDPMEDSSTVEAVEIEVEEEVIDLPPTESGYGEAQVSETAALEEIAAPEDHSEPLMFVPATSPESAETTEVSPAAEESFHAGSLAPSEADPGDSHALPAEPAESPEGQEPWNTQSPDFLGSEVTGDDFDSPSPQEPAGQEAFAPAAPTFDETPSLEQPPAYEAETDLPQAEEDTPTFAESIEAEDAPASEAKAGLEAFPVEMLGSIADGVEEATDAPEEESTPSPIEEPPVAEAPPAKVQVVGAQIIPPEDLDGPGTAFLSDLSVTDVVQDSALEEAQRLARLLVSEIKLYNEEEVNLGRKNNDIYARLQDDIDRSQQIFNDRVDKEELSGKDPFREELVRILAGGSEAALGY